MSVFQISRVLEGHGVPFYIQGNRIFADSMVAFTAIFEEVVDVTNYTPEQLRAWLGY